MTPDAYSVDLSWRDGDAAHIRAGDGESILAAAEAAGLSLPFGCRTGACATCTGRVFDGDVLHSRPPRALKSRHLDAGYVLTCIATPTTDCQLEVGADVATDLVSNPWK